MNMRQAFITKLSDAPFEVMVKSILHGYKHDKAYQVLILSITQATASAFVQSVLRGAVPDSVRCVGLDTIYDASPESPSGFVFLMPELAFAAPGSIGVVDNYLRKLSYHTQIVSVNSVLCSMRASMYDNWMRTKYKIDDLSRIVPTPESRVLHFTREHFDRYIYNGGDAYREFPVIDADVVVLGYDLHHLSGQDIGYLVYKLTDDSDTGNKAMVHMDRLLLETYFEHERWLVNNGGMEPAMKMNATVDPVREVLRPMDPNGYTVWREDKPVALPYYDKQWQLVTPPAKRGKRK